MFCSSSLMRTLKNLLHFFVTLKGPRYGGCRECDLAVSQTNTCVHFSRAFGTYVLMLLFSPEGEYAILAIFLVSLSTHDVTSHTFSGGSKKYCAGRRKVVPYSASAAEQSICLFTTVRSTNNISGRCSNHFALLVSTARKEAFRLRCNRSTAPFACGWYAVVWMFLVPKRADSLWKSSDSNWRPLSVVTRSGHQISLPIRQEMSWLSCMPSYLASVVLQTTAKICQYRSTNSIDPHMWEWTGDVNVYVLKSFVRHWKCSWRCTCIVGQLWPFGTSHTSSSTFSRLFSSLADLPVTHQAYWCICTGVWYSMHCIEYIFP